LRLGLLAADPPDGSCKDFIEARNPDSLKVVTACVEPSLAAAKPGDKFQFERFGYFVKERGDHVAARRPSKRRDLTPTLLLRKKTSACDAGLSK